MFSPIVFHRLWNTAVEPVKWIPAKLGSLSSTRLTSTASPGTKLMTPGGPPASCSRQKKCQLLSAAVDEGFQTPLLPIGAGGGGGFPPMAVKLNGVMA